MPIAVVVTDGERDCGCIRRGLTGARLQRNRKNESWTIQSCYDSFIWDPSGVQKAVLYHNEPIHVLRTEQGNLKAAEAANKLKSSI